jgi:hypothetical protein
MAMPKGYKSQNGYGTSKTLGGISYHEIAKKMNDMGFKMNHSTARNVFVTSLIKIANHVTKLYDIKFNEKDLKRIAIDPRFQEAIAALIKEYNNVNEN